MNHKTKESKLRLRYWAGIALSWLGLSGVVDGILEWRDFFGNIFKYYSNFRNYIFDFMPLDIHPFFADYIIVGIATMTMLKYIRSDIMEGNFLENPMHQIIWNEYKQNNFINRFLRELLTIPTGIIKVYRLSRDQNQPLIAVFLTVIFWYSWIAIFLWPLVFLTYRSLFAAFYPDERRLAFRWFFLVFSGMVIIVFIFADIQRSTVVVN